MLIKDSEMVISVYRNLCEIEYDSSAAQSSLSFVTAEHLFNQLFESGTQIIKYDLQGVEAGFISEAYRYYHALPNKPDYKSVTDEPLSNIKLPYSDTSKLGSIFYFFNKQPKTSIYKELDLYNSLFNQNRDFYDTKKSYFLNELLHLYFSENINLKTIGAFNQIFRQLSFSTLDSTRDISREKRAVDALAKGLEKDNTIINKMELDAFNYLVKQPEIVPFVIKDFDISQSEFNRLDNILNAARDQGLQYSQEYLKRVFHQFVKVDNYPNVINVTTWIEDVWTPEHKIALEILAYSYFQHHAQKHTYSSGLNKSMFETFFEKMPGFESEDGEDELVKKYLPEALAAVKLNSMYTLSELIEMTLLQHRHTEEETIALPEIDL